jgi:hypothetical protein
MSTTTRTARHAAQKRTGNDGESDWVVDLTRGTAYRLIHPATAVARRNGTALIAAAAAIWAFDVVFLVSHIAR